MNNLTAWRKLHVWHVKLHIPVWLDPPPQLLFMHVSIHHFVLNIYVQFVPCEFLVYSWKVLYELIYWDMQARNNDLIQNKSKRVGPQLLIDYGCVIVDAIV